MAKLKESFYDPERSYEENVQHGPFGLGAKGEKYRTLGRPTRLFFGQPVHLDLGVAAGPLVTGKWVEAALDLGWDVVTYKTVRSQAHQVNGNPNLLPTQVAQFLHPEMAETGVRTGRSFSFPSSPTNTFGVPSFPPDIWVPDATHAVQHAEEGQVVVVSFQGTATGEGDDSFVRDHGQVAKLVKQTGAKVLENNQSCVNEGKENLLCYDYRTSRRVVELVRKVIGDDTIFLVKIGYFSDQSLLEKYLAAVGPFIDGVTAINTIAAKVVNERGEPAFGAGRERAGISGAYIRPYGLDMVTRITRIAEKLNLDLAVVGTGGVFGPKDYDEYKEAGATGGVSTATGFIASPKMVHDVKRSLGMQVVKVKS